MKCHCGLKEYEQCCGRFLENEGYGDGDSPETPEELMRSRYSAYVLKKFPYIIQTTDPQTRNQIDHKANEQWANETEFLKLEIISSSQEKNKGTVEFKAHFKNSTEESIHHELSKFRRSEGLWYFRDGKSVPPAK